ncbi:glycosyltransferase [soil metagenome]
MRVLHVHEASTGGVVSYLRELATEQVRRGHDVHVLAPTRSMAAGVHQHDWGLVRRRPGSYPRAVNELARTVRTVGPDVIHLHSFWAGLFGRLPAPRRGTAATVYQPHSWSAQRFDNPLYTRLLWAVERGASRRTHALVANCADEVDEGRRGGVRTPAYALGIPLDIERFTPADADARQRFRLQLGMSGVHMLLCLGRLGRQKGQDLLVAAWERAPVPGSELVLVGAGDVAALRALAPRQWGKTVRVVANQDDVRPWIWASDVLVVPSRYEGMSVAVAEALACGRPVVAGGVNGAAEAVADPPLPPAGAVVPRGDMDSLLDEAARRLRDPALWEAESAQARCRAEQQYTPAAVVDRLELAYAGAADRRLDS